MISVPSHYSINKITTIEDLKKLFPDGKCDELNFVLFSTSGVHGSYTTLDEIEDILKHEYHLLDGEDENYCENKLTVLVIQPRVVCMYYGHIEITEEDIPFLKSLMQSTKKAVEYYFD